MEIVENWSRIVGTVQEWQPPADPSDPGVVVVRVDGIGTVKKGDRSYPNLLTKSVGEILSVQVPSIDAQGLDLARGMRIELEVRRGRTAGKLFARAGTITASR